MLPFRPVPGALLTAALATATATGPDPAWAQRGYPPRARGPLGFRLTIGAGIVDFTGETLDSLTEVGGAYDLRLHVFSRRIVGFELAWVSTRQDVRALGLSREADLESDGLEATARLNLGALLVPEGREPALAPFAFAGGGFARFHLANEGPNLSVLGDDDYVVVVPVGGGLAIRWEHYVLETRFTYRASFDGDLVAHPPGPTDGAPQDHWLLHAALGLAF